MKILNTLQHLVVHIHATNIMLKLEEPEAWRREPLCSTLAALSNPQEIEPSKKVLRSAFMAPSSSKTSLSSTECYHTRI